MQCVYARHSTKKIENGKRDEKRSGNELDFAK